VPAEYLALGNLVGPAAHIRERIGAYREAGVTVLSVTPAGPDPVKTMETLKQIVTDVGG
jgi:hypothetical protein